MPVSGNQKKEKKHMLEEVILNSAASGVCASCGASFPVSRKNCPTENVSSLRSVKGATLPCAAYAAIPCGLAVCKQHKMLFAASKFEGE